MAKVAIATNLHIDLRTRQTLKENKQRKLHLYISSERKYFALEVLYLYNHQPLLLTKVTQFHVL